MSNAIELWHSAWKECLGDKDLTNARVAGRKSKDKPNKEDVAQWQIQGPQWVSEYMQWRQANPNWKIWKTPQGAPAIELGLNPTIAGITVKMFIDRVFEVDGHLVVLDLKTSSREPQSALQLGFYKYGLEDQFQQPVDFGTYFMARQQGPTAMIDLSWYEREKIEYLVETFDKSRRAGIFLPNAESCGLCGFTKICPFTSKKQNQGEISE